MGKRCSKTYCVWQNEKDQIIAIDETAEKCAEKMKITKKSFYDYATGKKPIGYTIIKSENI